MMKCKSLLVSLFFASSLVQATDYDTAVNVCSSLAGITQEALEEMGRHKIPLEKTQIYREVAHDPNIVRSLKSASALHKRGVSIQQVVDSWAAGCMNALTGQPAQGSLARQR